MTKQMKRAMAAMLMVGTLPMMAQTSQTDVVKVAPGQTKKTVIHRKNGATDTVISEGTTTGGHKHRVSSHRKHIVKAPVESAQAREIRELKEQQAAQQAEIDALTAAGAAKDQAIAQAAAQAQAAQNAAQQASSSVQSVTGTLQQDTDAVQQLKGNVTDLQTTNVGLAQTISANKTELTEKIESPTVIHYKGVKITPVAFFAFEGVYRRAAVNSDINTPFNTIPYPGSDEGHISELNFTARQSRLGALVEGDAGPYKLSGYFESDFLSAGVTSNENQSNSYTFRVRQIWGKAETKSGFAVTGGQTWSLVTEDGKATDVRTEKLPNTVDSQYMVGYSWARQPAIRLQQKFGNPILGAAATFAISAEQAQTQLAGTTNAPFYEFGGAGQNGGLLNGGAQYNGSTTAGALSANANYANNVVPDLMFKAAFDAKYYHFEFGGVARFFRDEYYPVTYTFTAPSTTPVVCPGGTGCPAPGAIQKNTALGGGYFGSLRLISPKVEVAFQGMGGPGVGRYGSSQLGDVTVKPSGQLEPVKNYHGLFTLETHPSKKLDLYAYYGAEYNQRTIYALSSTYLIGSGVPNTNVSGCYTNTIGTPGTTAPGTGLAPGAVANCSPVTRVIQEGMVGFTYKVIASPKYGTLRYQGTYSYFQKDGWAGLASGTYNTASAVYLKPHATDSMIDFSMRYYIP